MKTKAVLAILLAFFIVGVYATESDSGMDEEATMDGDSGAITYTSPIKNALPPVKGKTLKKLTTDSTPAVPPFDGVDVSEMKCNSCHQAPDGWSSKELCEVAKIFSKSRARIYQNPSKDFKVQHPFGGHLKKALASWADTDCQGMDE